MFPGVSLRGRPSSGPTSLPRAHEASRASQGTTHEPQLGQRPGAPRSHHLVAWCPALPLMGTNTHTRVPLMGPPPRQVAARLRSWVGCPQL